MNSAIYEYCLRIGDTSLVLAHRLSEWCGHGPILEEDIALQNMALDLIGQARTMLSYAGQIEGEGRDEDELAFKRDARQFRNLMMAEQPNGDFAKTMTRHFFLSTYQYYFFNQLVASKDETIKGFAQKAIKEVTYHLRHSTDWMLRLGDGTEESNVRLQEAIDELQQYVDDLFDVDAIDRDLHAQGIGADLEIVKQQWLQKINEVCTQAKVKFNPVANFTRTGSRKGIHTEHLGYILAEMQWLPRAYPGTQW
ncbi:MAG: phenylacetate-CoA oxygenase subunit PaaC [Bacteroidetes bacterium]|nr:phenylacetate-CoA oxygenase subunit PaaC [Bacteroidota bacterium]